VLCLSRDAETDRQTVVYESSADEWTGDVNECRTLWSRSTCCNTAI